METKKKNILIGIIIIVSAIVFLIIILTPGMYNRNIEVAINKAILVGNEDSYYRGETQTEGHKILKAEKIDGNQLKVYCIVSYGEFS